MKRSLAKRVGFLLYSCLMLSIPAVIYLEIHGYVILGIALVCIMFGLSMGLLWVSEAEDSRDKEAEGKQRLRQRG
ncbi:hypothetical protein [Paenibacillus rigui]|uniref:Uncharacterized protein n=1 Tax=Paenibacillus rigui TaxID=554312 RepID=A0A229ULV5_9BACL|nr:hypothetical protein [Paenibacillus rigui]OXM84362.1 hypothetical protein CF651_21525 [Paenibacillus rigui]